MVVGLVPKMINPKCSGGSWGCTECYGLCGDVGFLPQQVNNRHCPKEAFGEEGSHCSWSYPISVTPFGDQWIKWHHHTGPEMNGARWLRWRAPRHVWRWFISMIWLAIHGSYNRNAQSKIHNKTTHMPSHDMIIQGSMYCTGSIQIVSTYWLVCIQLHLCVPWQVDTTNYFWIVCIYRIPFNCRACFLASPVNDRVGGFRCHDGDAAKWSLQHRWGCPDKEIPYRSWSSLQCETFVKRGFNPSFWVCFSLESCGRGDKEK